MKPLAVKPEKLMQAFQITMEDYANGVDECVKTANEAAVSHAAQTLQRTRFSSGSGAYAQSWTYGEYETTKTSYGMVAYAQAPHYRLTHLLEYGHDVKRKKGGKVLGHAKAIQHIRPAQKEAEERWKTVFKEELEGIRN